MWGIQPYFFYLTSHRAVSSGGFDEKKSLSQAELERQQILNEMKKKTSLLTDNSWIRQSSCSTTYSKETDIPPMRRYSTL